MRLGWPIWNPAHNNPVPPSAITPEFHAALWAEIQSRWQKFMHGIARYHAHPYARPAATYPTLFQDGTTRLYDCGTGGAPVLIIPSLVNRAYILDLLPEKSFLKHLARAGLHPYLLDWCAPGETENAFDLSDYITRRLLPAYHAVTARHGKTPEVLGYCMGGNMALALAQIVPQKPSALVLMATPWDFHAAGMPRLPADMATKILEGIATHRPLPVDILQSFFAAIDPFGTVQKFMKFSEMEAHSDAATLFVALEDWLSDGVPLPARVARDTLQSWYVENTPQRGGWHVGGVPIQPATLNLPTLAVLPQQDRIVSPASAAALAAAIPGALSLTPDMGHIGMMVGREAETRVWEPIAAWLKSNST